MGGKISFRAEVAQGCVGGNIGHNKASRVVKNRKTMLIGYLRLFLGLKFSQSQVNLLPTIGFSNPISQVVGN